MRTYFDLETSVRDRGRVLLAEASAARLAALATCCRTAGRAVFGRLADALAVLTRRRSQPAACCSYDPA